MCASQYCTGLISEDLKFLVNIIIAVQKILYKHFRMQLMTIISACRFRTNDIIKLMLKLIPKQRFSRQQMTRIILSIKKHNSFNSFKVNHQPVITIHFFNAFEVFERE